MAMHTSTANAKLNAAVIAKLHAEGSALAAPWNAIEAVGNQPTVLSAYRHARSGGERTRKGIGNDKTNASQ